MSEHSMDTAIKAQQDDTREQVGPAKSLEKTPAKKVFIKTYGCQMNVYDSERMEDALGGEGYESVSSMEDADLILLNTCHIREKAAEKVYSEIGRIRKIKQQRENSSQPFMLGITGCVAQAEGEEIIKRAPLVDFVVGPQTYHLLPDIIRKAESGSAVVETGFDIEAKFRKLPNATDAQTRQRGVTAFLTVQEGCDKFCTFCVVPYTRGAEVSRSVRQIRQEAERLVDVGVREITLLGQNVNAWHGAGPDGKSWALGQLLHELAKIDRLDRLRYTTSHPIDMDDALIEAHRDIDILMPYLHLPVQAGSNRILKAMNRHHTREQYLTLIERIRGVRSDIAMSGDFIVGFPGETDEDFEETLALIREVNYASAFSFKYSPRPGTPGADMADQVCEAVMKERLERLQSLLNEQQLAFNQSCVGQQMNILLEKPAKSDGQLIGRSPWLQSVVVKAQTSQIGEIVPVTISSGGPNSLQADLI